MTQLILETVEFALQIIVRLISKGNWNQALTHLQALVIEFPDNALTHFFTGLCYQKLGNNQKACIAFERSVELEPFGEHAFYAHHSLGLELRRQATENHEEPNATLLAQAAHHFMMAIRHNKTGENGLQLTRLADCFAALKQGGPALKYYSEAIAEGYRVDYCLYSQAVIYYFDKRYEEAEASLDHVLRIDPEHVNAFLLRAKIFAKTGRAEAASDDIQKALPLLEKAAKSLEETETKVFVINPNVPATFWAQDDAAELPYFMVADAYGMLALHFATLKDWQKSAVNVNRSLEYHQSNMLAVRALALRAEHIVLSGRNHPAAADTHIDTAGNHQLTKEEARPAKIQPGSAELDPLQAPEEIQSETNSPVTDSNQPHIPHAYGQELGREYLPESAPDNNPYVAFFAQQQQP